MTTTGNPAPAIDPGETMLGLAVIVITISLLVPPNPSCTTHVAFVPQAMSATLFVLAPVHAAGPEFRAAPQSLSVTRMTAPAEIDIDFEKSIVI